uniref:Uncharacterized protein n=1 Tax=Arundo donax TaxID=35708 RepID=A0A0A9A9P5_ARUDO
MLMAFLANAQLSTLFFF